MLVSSEWLFGQSEAEQLRNVMSGGTKTKIVVLGIGNSVDEAELNSTASTPARRNVIRVQDFTSLMTVREQLRSTSCTGKSIYCRVVIQRAVLIVTSVFFVFLVIVGFLSSFLR